MVNVMDAFVADMIYVMLSRACSIIQIYILNEFDESKMRPNVTAMTELERLESMSNKKIEENTENFMIYSLNCRSLRKHYADIISDNEILQSDVICL